MKVKTLYYSLETAETYCKYEYLKEAREDFNMFKEQGKPVELYRVGEDGLCRTIRKHGIFPWEKSQLTGVG